MCRLRGEEVVIMPRYESAGPSLHKKRIVNYRKYSEKIVSLESTTFQYERRAQGVPNKRHHHTNQNIEEENKNTDKRTAQFLTNRQEE